MENRERNYIYAVPFIGGIVCIISLFAINPSVIFTFSLIGLIGILILIHPEIVFGIMMIVSAIKMRSGKTTWIEQKKKLMIISWILVGITLGFTIFTLVLIGQIAIIFEYGFVGGLLNLMGYYYDRYTANRAYMTGPALIQEKENFKLGPMKDQVSYANPKFCTNCGFKFEVVSLKFCPECGNQLAFK